MKRLASQSLSLLVVGMLIWHSVSIAADWDLQSLMQELARRSSGQAHFSETKYLAVLDKPIVQNGTLAFAPGRLEKFTRQPHRERMTVVGDTLTIETGPEGKARQLRLQRFPVVWAFIEGMRATLTGDLDTLERFYEIELHGSPGDWEMVMVPRQREMVAAVRLISIRGERNRIAIIEVVQSGGDRSVMRITESGP